MCFVRRTNFLSLQMSYGEATAADDANLMAGKALWQADLEMWSISCLE